MVQYKWSINQTLSIYKIWDVEEMSVRSKGLFVNAKLRSFTIYTECMNVGTLVSGGLCKTIVPLMLFHLQIQAETIIQRGVSRCPVKTIQVQKQLLGWSRDASVFT